jgi:putative membrane protein
MTFSMSLALLHAGRPLAPHDAWGAWTRDPLMLLVVVLPAALYAVGVRRLWRRAGRGRGITPREGWAFAGGVAALAVALLSPLHAVGEVLVSAHMVQHTLLMLVAAPLLAAGRPLVGLTWGLSPAGRRACRYVAQGPGVRGTLRALGSWQGGLLAHGAAIWIWHAPALYATTRTSAWVHALQHASLFGTALCFWWAPVAALRRRAAVGGAVFSLFLTTMHTGALAALLTFASGTWYAYGAGSASWGLTPLEDQQLAGIVMWATGSVAYPLVALVLLAGVLRAREPHRPRRRVEPTVSTAAARALLPALLATVTLLGGCGTRKDDAETAARLMTGGDPGRGRAAIRRYGCGTCHTVPGVRGADALVGPPLGGLSERAYLGGVVPNAPDSLVQWIMSPSSLAPRTAMPDLEVGAQDARDIAAYLYTLR